MSPTYEYVIKLFLESEFQHKETNEKNANSEQKLTVFLVGTNSENKNIYILHRK